MRISTLRRLVTFAVLLGVFAYFLFISFNEELLFLMIFVTIIYSVYRLFGDSVGLQLDNYTNQIAKDFVVLASSKAVALHTLRDYSKKVSVLSDNFMDLVAFSANLCETLALNYENEFRDAFVLLKHKQLKLLLIEGYQLLRLLYIRRFMYYWREVRDLLLVSVRSEAGSSLENISDEFSVLGNRVKAHFNWLNLDSEDDSSVITSSDIVSTVVLLRTIR